MRVLTHDKIEYTNGSEQSECHGLPLLCWAYLQEMDFEKIVQVIMKHDLFNAM